MRIMKNIRTWIVPLLFIGGLWSLAAVQAPAFTLDCEEISDKSEEQQAAWIDRQMKQAAIEQKQIGQERFDQRARVKESVGIEMRAQAVQRLAKIDAIRQARQVRERESSDGSAALVLGGLALLLAGGAFAYWRHRRPPTFEMS
jgi:hypothetical protein